MTYILFSIACDCVLWYTTALSLRFTFFAVSRPDFVIRVNLAF